MLVFCLLCLSISQTSEAFPCERHFLFADGKERSYLLCPPETSLSSYPLLIALHGGLGNAREFLQKTRLHEFLEDFILVYPDGTPGRKNRHRRVWNAGRCCGKAAKENVGDVSFLSALIEKVSSEFPVRRVFVVGFSNGGMMAYRLACEISEQLAGIAVFSGTLVYDTCDFDKAKDVAILHVHGLEDRFVPFYGGIGKLTRVRYPNMKEVLEAFAAPRKCQGPFKENGNFRVKLQYECLSGAPIEVHLLKYQGHKWLKNLFGKLLQDFFAETSSL